MGLDMYLNRKTYISRFDNVDLSVKRDDGSQYNGIVPERVKYVIEEVGYWRKANAIHNWIVQNLAEGVDDCKEVYFPQEEMQELLKLVTRVLKSKKDSVAAELLPPCEGFFFGSREIDDGYWYDLQNTKEILENALKLGGDFYYQASW